MSDLNELEIALLSENSILDLYLEITPTRQIRADIEDIRLKAALSTPAGELRERILAALNK